MCKIEGLVFRVEAWDVEFGGSLGLRDSEV